MNASVGAGNLAGIKLHTGDSGRNIGRDNEVSMRSRSEGGNAERRMTAMRNRESAERWHARTEFNFRPRRCGPLGSTLARACRPLRMKPAYPATLDVRFAPDA